MNAFKGTITSTENVDLIRLDKELFRTHPEFQQNAKVHAHVIANGHLLISLVKEKDVLLFEQSEEDPVVNSFLNFLEQDMNDTPSRITTLTSGKIAQAVELTSGVNVHDRDEFPEVITL